MMNMRHSTLARILRRSGLQIQLDLIERNSLSRRMS